MTSPIRVIGIVGSLRAASYNGQLLRAAVELAPPELAFSSYDLATVPLFNQDLEAEGDPAPVAAVRAAVRDCDAVLIASPEYNYGVPGVLKNAIDWLSRPPGQSPFRKKPVAIMGASMGPGGTVRMQLQLRVALQYLDMYAMPRPEVVVATCKDKFDASGRLTDARTRESLTAFLAAFVAWCRLFPVSGGG
jgi:chromate reductase